MNSGFIRSVEQQGGLCPVPDSKNHSFRVPKSEPDPVFAVKGLKGFGHVTPTAAVEVFLPAAALGARRCHDATLNYATEPRFKRGIRADEMETVRTSNVLSFHC